MFRTRIVLLTVAACGSMAMSGVDKGDDKRPTPDDAPVKDLVAYFARNGFKLEPGERGWWVVTDPKSDGYQVTVSLRTFPTGATEEEMLGQLKTINLAYMLNAPVRVAMSYPGLRVTDPKKQPPPLDQIPAAAKLKTLFKEYRPRSG